MQNIWKFKMPKYFSFKVCGYYLYFTSKCILEAMRVHASDSKLTEESSAKFFVKGNGDSVLQERGRFTTNGKNIVKQVSILENSSIVFLCFAE